jgi:hypothetical protein
MGAGPYERLAWHLDTLTGGFPATKALRLVRKPREVQPLVPSTVAASMLRLAWKRRQAGPLALLRLLAGSHKDRLRLRVKSEG